MAQYRRHHYDGFEDELASFDEYAYDVFQTGAMPATSPAPKPKKKSRWKAAVVATVLIIGAGFGVWMMSGQSTSLLWGPIVSKAKQTHEADVYDEPLVEYSAFSGNSAVNGGVPEAVPTPVVPEESKTTSEVQEDPVEVSAAAAQAAYEQWEDYYLRRLDVRLQVDYHAILDAINNMNDEIELPMPLAVTDLERVIDCVRADHPEIFWLEDEYSCWLEDDICVSLSFKYCVNRTERDQTAALIDAKASEMATAVGHMTSDYEKVCFFYHVITENTVYDMSLPSMLTQTPVGPFLNGVSACAGYTRAMQMACKKANIPCICVLGTAPDSSAGNGTGPHAWNAVIIDGVACYMDVTWGDADDVNFHYDETYLGLTTSDMAATGHVWKYPDLAPICDDPAREAWIMRNAALGSYDVHAVAHAVTERLNAGENIMYLRFPDNNCLDAFLYDFCEEGSGAVEAARNADVVVGTNGMIEMYARFDKALNVVAYTIR